MDTKKMLLILTFILLSIQLIGFLTITGAISGKVSFQVLSSDGRPCSLATECVGGFCIHSICRSTSTFCGDGFCDSGESCGEDISGCPTGFACTDGCQEIPVIPFGGPKPIVPEVPEPIVIEKQIIETITPISPAKIIIEKSEEVKLQEITIEVKNIVSNVKLEFSEVEKPTEAPAPIAEEKGSVYTYIKIREYNIKDEDVTKANIKFKVENTWIDDNIIDADSVTLNRLADDKWNKLPTTRLSEDSDYVYYEAESPGLSVFTITGEKKVIVPECSPCPLQTNWSDCIDNKQIRINYNCSSDTDYLCESYEESRDCVVERVLPITLRPEIILLILLCILIISFVLLKKGREKRKRKRK